MNEQDKLCRVEQELGLYAEVSAQPTIPEVAELTQKLYDTIMADLGPDAHQKIGCMTIIVRSYEDVYHCRMTSDPLMQPEVQPEETKGHWTVALKLRISYFAFGDKRSKFELKLGVEPLRLDNAEGRL